MESILVIVYIILGYWAANKVWYSKRVYLVSDGGKFFVQKMVVAIFLGWILIPVALVQLLLENGGEIGSVVITSEKDLPVLREGVQL